MKKIISLLAVVALVAVLATAVFAADEVALKIDTVDAAAGDEVVINISMVNNPGLTVGEFKITYDTKLDRYVTNGFSYLTLTAEEYEARITERNG